MRQILFLVGLCLTVFGDDLGSLLTKYNQETQLHKDTKKEAAGDITLFTREDLDRMQAYTLNDVLNTIRMFNLQASRSGGTSIAFATSKSSAVTLVKIFINNHELNNATFGNPLAQYGDMNLYFVDYIEVYQAGNSVTFGNESGSMVIKLYTKKPELENATYGEATLDSKGSKQVNILDAKVIDKDYSYLVNFDVNDRFMDKQSLNGYNISRNYSIVHLFFQFNKKDDYTIELGATDGKKNSFGGFSLTPLYDEQNGENIYLHVDKKLPQNFTLRASSSIEKVWLTYVDGVGVHLSDGSNAKKIHSHGQTTSSSITLEKQINYENNQLTIATKVKQNSGKLYYFKADGVEKNLVNGPTIRNIYSIYGEDLYNIDDNNLISFGMKYNNITDNYSSKTENDVLYRLGYVSNYKSFKNKIFVFNRVNQPTMSQKSFSPVKIKSNVDLVSTKIKIISADSEYQFDKQTKFNLGMAVAEVDDAITVNPVKKQFVNVSDTISFKRIYLRLEHKFDLHNKILLGWYKVYKDKSFTPASGVLVQAFNKFGKVDVYNELVYRDGYKNEIGKKLDAGYDYTLAITYPVSKQSILKLKGENIFNDASEVYIYDDPSQGGIYEPARQQRMLVSWEYEF